jgi:hypothetical protein
LGSRCADGQLRNIAAKAELKRADITYEELAEKLGNHGLEEPRESVASKLSQERFAATFLLVSLAALGVENLRLEDI